MKPIIMSTEDVRAVLDKAKKRLEKAKAQVSIFDSIANPQGQQLSILS